MFKVDDTAMNSLRKLNRWVALCAGLMLAINAQAAQRLCVYDPLGANGYLANMMKDYAIAMQRNNVFFEIKTYTNETLAVEDFRVGQCDAFWSTAFRSRQFNSITAAIDSLGATSIIRNGRVDTNSSYEVLRKLIQTFSTRSPKVQQLVVRGDYEVGGIMPLGIAYPIVNDRSIDSIEKIAGKRIAAFDYDKAQAMMIKKYGGQPVSSDTTNFHTKFNNGIIDLIAAPTIAYKPLELAKGIGTKGAIVRFPIMLLTFQMIMNRTKFPEDFGAISREYWATQIDRALQLVRLTDSDIPLATWNDLDADKSVQYTLLMRETRIEIAKAGYYDKRGLRIIKRVRCKVNAADAECSTKSEEEWD
jgi:Family of unknown function (DUF6091)